MSDEEELKRLRHEVSRLRNLVLLMARVTGALPGSPPGHNKSSTINMNALFDYVQEDEIEFQTALQEGGEGTNPRDTKAFLYLELFQKLTEEEQAELLEEHGNDEEASIRHMRAILATRREPNMVKINKGMKVIDLEAQDREPVTLENFEEKLATTLMTHVNLPLNASTCAHIHRGIMDLLHSLILHEEDLGPDFWHVEVEPDTEQGMVSTVVVPRILHEMARDDVWMEQDASSLIAYARLPGREEPLSASSDNGMKAMVDLARQVSMHKKAMN